MSTFLPAFLGNLTFLHPEADGHTGIEVNTKREAGLCVAGGSKTC